MDIPAKSFNEFFENENEVRENFHASLARKEKIAMDNYARVCDMMEKKSPKYSELRNIRFDPMKHCSKWEPMTDNWHFEFEKTIEKAQTLRNVRIAQKISWKLVTKRGWSRVYLNCPNFVKQSIKAIEEICNKSTYLEISCQTSKKPLNSVSIKMNSKNEVMVIVYGERVAVMEKEFFDYFSSGKGHGTNITCFYVFGKEKLKLVFGKPLYDNFEEISPDIHLWFVDDKTETNIMNTAVDYLKPYDYKRLVTITNRIPGRHIFFSTKFKEIINFGMKNRIQDSNGYVPRSSLKNVEDAAHVLKILERGKEKWTAFVTMESNSCKLLDFTLLRKWSTLQHIVLVTKFEKKTDKWLQILMDPNDEILGHPFFPIRRCVIHSPFPECFAVVLLMERTSVPAPIPKNLPSKRKSNEPLDFHDKRRSEEKPVYFSVNSPLEQVRSRRPSIESPRNLPRYHKSSREFESPNEHTNSSVNSPLEHVRSVKSSTESSRNFEKHFINSFKELKSPIEQTKSPIELPRIPKVSNSSYEKQNKDEALCAKKRPNDEKLESEKLKKSVFPGKSLTIVQDKVIEWFKQKKPKTENVSDTVSDQTVQKIVLALEEKFVKRQMECRYQLFNQNLGNNQKSVQLIDVESENVIPLENGMLMEMEKTKELKKEIDNLEKDPKCVELSKEQSSNSTQKKKRKRHKNRTKKTHHQKDSVETSTFSKEDKKKEKHRTMEERKENEDKKAKKLNYAKSRNAPEKTVEENEKDGTKNRKIQERDEIEIVAEICHPEKGIKQQKNVTAEKNSFENIPIEKQNFNALEQLGNDMIQENEPIENFENQVDIQQTIASETDVDSTNESEIPPISFVKVHSNDLKTELIQYMKNLIVLNPENSNSLRNICDGISVMFEQYEITGQNTTQENYLEKFLLKFTFAENFLSKSKMWIWKNDGESLQNLTALEQKTVHQMEEICRTSTAFKYRCKTRHFDNFQLEIKKNQKNEIMAIICGDLTFHMKETLEKHFLNGNDKNPNIKSLFWFLNESHATKNSTCLFGKDNFSVRIGSKDIKLCPTTVEYEEFYESDRHLIDSCITAIEKMLLPRCHQTIIISSFCKELVALAICDKFKHIIHLGAHSDFLQQIHSSNNIENIAYHENLSKEYSGEVCAFVQQHCETEEFLDLRSIKSLQFVLLLTNLKYPDNKFISDLLLPIYFSGERQCMVPIQGCRLSAEDSNVFILFERKNVPVDSSLAPWALKRMQSIGVQTDYSCLTGYSMNQDMEMMYGALPFSLFPQEIQCTRLSSSNEIRSDISESSMKTEIREDDDKSNIQKYTDAEAPLMVTEFYQYPKVEHKVEDILTENADVFNDLDAMLNLD